MWDYTKSVIDHFTNPRNVGELKDANAVGQVGSLACGDALKLYLKIDPGTGVIEDAKFKTFGCASAIASASALTEMVKGKSLQEAMNITNDDIARFLGGLPEQKMHCSVMGREALEAAIADYKGEKTVHKEESPVICKCFWVTEQKIRDVIRENNLTEVAQITNFTKAGGGCGGCTPDLQRILDEAKGKPHSGSASQKSKGSGMTNLRKIALVTETIEKEIAPALRRDGGNIELIDVVGTKVIVRLMGACSNCPGARSTLQNFVQETLRSRVSPDLTVEEES